jgi:membrane-associated phospholipid phosphatase
VKRISIFYWLLGIIVIGLVLGAAFYLDSTVEGWVTQHQTRAMRHLMRGVSRWGDWMPHVSLGLVLLAGAWWRGSKKWIRVFLAMLIALAFAGVVGRGIKIVTARPRPSVNVAEIAHWSHFSSKFHAFPSGHVAASMAFFGILLFVKRGVGVACLPIPIFIGFARIYLRAHYLSDAVGGIILGLLCAALLAHFLIPSKPKSTSEQ